MNEFKTYHPMVNLTYFAAVIGFSMFFMHPICLIISLLSAFVYSLMLKGMSAVKINLIGLLPLMIVTAIINPTFNHEGMTILGYLPSGNPFTLESAVYGCAAACMLACVICWFFCYNEVMTSDKFIYLFGKVIPSLSLVLSMTLRFVPKFSEQLKKVINARKCLGRGECGGIIKRVRDGLTVLSAIVTWSLENALETADSMKARGYGLSGRSSFSLFKFEKRDRSVMLLIIFLGAYVLLGKICGKIDFSYFPQLKADGLSAYAVSIFSAYALLCVCPIAIEIWEAVKWKRLKSKI